MSQYPILLATYDSFKYTKPYTTIGGNAKIYIFVAQVLDDQAFKEAE